MRSAILPIIIDRGQTYMAFETMVSTLPYVQNGRLRALGVTTATRASAAPNIPTIAESGLPGFSGNNGYGFVAPANTPKAVIDRLHGEIVRILGLPDVKETLTALGAEVVGSAPDEFAGLIKSEIAKWAKVVRESGAQPNQFGASLAR